MTHYKERYSLSYWVISVCISVFLAVVFLGVFFFVASPSFDMPIVYKSTWSGVCVKAEYEGDTIPCDIAERFNRYDTVWVK